MALDAIVRVAARGDGVSASGRHVALAAPGDAIDEAGRVIAGPHHREPPCRHFPRCGGCQLQHLDDESFSVFVHDRVAGALAAQGIVTAIRAPVLSPRHTRRRATLHTERRGGQVAIGFAEAGSHRLVDLAECHVLLPELFALVAPLRRLLAGALGDRRASIHLARVDQGVDILIGGALGETLAVAEAVTAFAESHRLARLAVDGGLGPEVRWAPAPVTVTLGGAPVAFPPGNFLQATCDGEAALVEAVREAVGAAAATADLFSGLGTFALSLSGKVYAAEAAREAALALKATGRVFVEHRDLFRRPLTKLELDRFDAIVIDPPRAGAREQVAMLATSDVPVIAYVSCNPSSFARDAKVLCEGGYRLEWVRPVGQFTWSTHVELAAAFIRRDNRRR